MNVILMVIQRKQNESYVEYEEKERYREMMRKKEKKDREREGETTLIYR